MNNDKMFKGVFPALLTVFGSDMKPDRGGIKATVDHAIEKCGVDGFYISGSTGENFLLPHDYKKTVIETAAKAADGRVKMIAHIGSNVTEEVAELALLAKDCGYDAVSAITPFYYKFSGKEIVEYYLRLADSSPLPLVIYNIPSYTSINLTINDFNRLFEHENIVGLKNSAQDFYMLERIMDTNPTKVFFTGVDEALLSASVLGVDGAIGSTYNFVGHWAKDIMCLAAEGKNAEALAVQKKLNTVVRLMLEAGIFPVMKALLALYGIKNAGCRPPFGSVTPEQENTAKVIFDIIG